MTDRAGELASSSSGVLALFSGLSGAGETMAAEVIASELGTSLYRVNPKQVVSRYIGETKGNLVRVFAAAQKKGVVLSNKHWSEHYSW